MVRWSEGEWRGREKGVSESRKKGKKEKGMVRKMVKIVKRKAKEKENRHR